MILWMLLAYLFSIGVRMYWPIHFADAASMHYNGQLMINTNDGYFFATGARDILAGSQHPYQGLASVTALAARILPFSLDTIILYMPAVVASLLVIPIILTGRLLGHTVLGFLAALIGSIAWSYYNRTMVGYYDSDMFAIFLQFTIFYGFLHIAYKKDLLSVVFTSALILAYPYFYPQGISITYAMFGMMIFYLFLEHKHIIQAMETVPFGDAAMSLYTIVLFLSIALMGSVAVEIRIALLGLALIAHYKAREQDMLILAVVAFGAFLYFGNVVDVLTGKLMLYLERGVEKEEGLHFYQVIQTVREAGAIPFSVIANRISGSMIGLILSGIGFVVLSYRHKPFMIALPLIGVGLFSYIGGLRFTVYAVPAAAISVVYLFWFLSDSFFKKTHIKYFAVLIGTAAMLYPNIQHIIGYKVPTVLNRMEVDDLEKLNQISKRTDYTLAWWDYGFPIWYFSDTSTLIDGGKHQNDNFIISKVMLTSSPELAANLGRLAIETYVESNHSVVANTLFKDTDPERLLKSLKEGTYPLPPKTRDVFLYLPYRMMGIFPTVAIFGNIDLQSGQQKRRVQFYPTRIHKQHGKQVILSNGIMVDMQKGEVSIGKKTHKIYRFDTTRILKNGKTADASKIFHGDGEMCVLYLTAYGQVIVMDKETYYSTFVQMLMLGHYDKKLFELVVSSPYSKIYKLKR
jgi:dolichyl-diphosphooligosaccharide--protein glycosyltransferase/undecaprenyl-diphosphooligosaccharide--protein glycosyltransferase